MIPSVLATAKADPRLPAVARVLLWCAERDSTVAPSAGMTARVLRMPRSTAKRAIATLVAIGTLTRAA